jgi:hypothetical protein
MKYLVDMVHINRLFMVSLYTLMCVGTAYAEGGGGGGGVGGNGASGPEPYSWLFMMTGVLVLCGIALYRTRVTHRDEQ